MRAAGYTIIEAVDGQHVLEVFGRERPDLIVMDVMMPRMTGLETCRILKAQHSAAYLPILMLSSRNTVGARVEGLRNGADDYLGKPYDPAELCARVEALLRTSGVVAAGLSADTTTSGSSLSIRDASEFRARLDEEFDRAERYADPLACLRIEADAYEAWNAVGESLADELVEQLQDVIVAKVRKIDILFRADPRGFLLVLPNTHFPGALTVAERIWRSFRRIRLPDALGGGQASASIGISFFPNRDTRSPRDLEELVESALEYARQNGGGKICLFQHQGYLYVPES